MLRACGLIVEYNPFHNGHLYHLQQAKKLTNADVVIAVMSGSFLQRGEPAIIDKFHRTKAALASGVDIVLELPYAYAVQSSQLFAKGSVLTLNALGVSHICFGSEAGDITDFITGHHFLKKHHNVFQDQLKSGLKQGLSYPAASKAAYDKIGLSQLNVDLSQPNNVLGFSYVNEILDRDLPIAPLTIPRLQSQYHDTEIHGKIASATSIRYGLFANPPIDVKHAIPKTTSIQLSAYKKAAGIWHQWENYFPLIHYRVQTMMPNELAQIAGVVEGLEYRIKHAARKVTSFQEWMNAIKSKRYTWTRLQRMFTNILTNTKEFEIKKITSTDELPYIRLLGLSNQGQAYLNSKKKQLTVQLITGYKRDMPEMLAIEERASNAYYSVLAPQNRKQLLLQEFQGPVRIENSGETV